ncbi:restriction endonuclease subunit S [Citrobacter portucalensis]|uniref:restriction endonuclease subunit S n=1 Tax=Citrobacter portucalensis TaxID=1639133 RepID=UPI001C8D520D|nr:restriction endonuclease subunit S [Citrobacter portucalensis]EHU7375784.1 restriction endonuclease subunit S [Citrobacter freundii]MDG9958792.1 restriction endonuclease subunit S [Citrobacter portucalensis]MDN4359858.1 restriction endonuclease subunit S [Citrobacter portucalensis]MDN4366055.1 restriction endonuclease subunit S [Citrobacter portucalensis]MDN4376547.1 restriction endonuclease subunit S [Citrobacter portucalensis]
MAKYKAYPEYKDSGVEWLGEIPTHWICTQIKYGYDITLGKMLQKNKSSSKDELKPYLKAQNIQPTGIDLSVVDNMWFSPDEKNKLLLKNDDVLISEGGDVGRSALWQGQLVECYIQNAINRARAIKGNSPYFLNYWMVYLKSADFINTLCNKATIAHYTAEKVETSPLLLPNSDEQFHISLFLDHETAKIDSLIEKQQQLIELLKEKRQAVISHAVTKGLNPDAPMKDSGVEWLGKVPEHWIPARLKYHTRQIVDGAHFTPTYTEKGIPFLRVTDIQDKYIDFDNIKFIPEHEHKELIKRCRPENGDLLLSKNGTIGVPKLIDWDWDFSIFVSLCLIKFKGTLTPEYSEFYFKSHEIKEQVFGLIKQSTVINLHLDKIQNLWFCIPPLEEQYKIVNYLNEKIDNLECLIESAELTIRLAQERRTALISAAVTGKIDVRDWVASDTQDVEASQEAIA